MSRQADFEERRRLTEERRRYLEARAKAMRAEGLQLKDIAARLGVSKTAASNYARAGES